jgi:MORN repeat
VARSSSRFAWLANRWVSSGRLSATALLSISTRHAEGARLSGGPIELPHGEGEAKGSDTYVGDFAKGRPDGKGIYPWESGARLEGSFKEGKAHGSGVYVNAMGARYEGQFVNGTLAGLKVADCPSTPGPLSC